MRAARPSRNNRLLVRTEERNPNYGLHPQNQVDPMTPDTPQANHMPHQGSGAKQGYVTLQEPQRAGNISTLAQCNLEPEGRPDGLEEDRGLRDDGRLEGELLERKGCDGNHCDAAIGDLSITHHG